MNVSKAKLVGCILLSGFFILLTGVKSYADGPAISGYVDTTYNYSFNNPSNGQTALRSYDAKANNFALNSAHLEFMGTLEDVTYNVQLDAGTDASVNNGTSGTANVDYVDIQEAYLAYTHPGTKLGYKVGKFATFMGIEVIEAKDNPTISRGYLFGLAEPYTHTGGVATYQAGKFDIALGAVNGFDLISDNNDQKTFIGKITGNFGDSLILTLSGASGPEQADTITGNTETFNGDANKRNTLDLTGVTKILPKVALWFQALYGDEENVATAGGSHSLSTWSGFGIQPVVTLSEKWSIGGRYEYMDDANGAKTGADNSAIYNVSITPTYKVSSNSLVRAEYRYDKSNNNLWLNDKAEFKDSTSTASLEFVVTF